MNARTLFEIKSNLKKLLHDFVDDYICGPTQSSMKYLCNDWME